MKSPFFKLYKSPKSLFFVGEWNHHFCWPKGMKSLCVCVLATSHESQLLEDITDTGLYHKIPWIFHEISMFADWSSRMLSCCVSSCTFDDTCHHGRKCYGAGPEQKWLDEPRKNEVFTNFNTQEWLSVFATKLWISLGTIEGIQTPK